MVTAGNRKRVVLLCLLALILTGAVAPVSATPNEAVWIIPYPGVLPVTTESMVQESVPLVIDQALLNELKASDFATREAAADRLILIGRPALPALQDLARNADDDVLWWIRAIIQRIEGNAPRRPGTGLTDSRMYDLLARGPNDQVLGTLKSIPASSSAALVDKYLQLEIGVDCIYSLNPSQIFPRAVELLPAQTDPFYQAMLLRLIRNVQERALLPIPGTPHAKVSQANPAFANTFSALAEAVQPYLTHAHPQLRREALLISAWSNLQIGNKVMEDLLQDPSPVVAREANRLCRLVNAEIAPPPDSYIKSWIRECVAALQQDPDGLAQLGAYYALYELSIFYPADLTHAATSMEAGRAKDALVWILSLDAGGRAYLLNAGWADLPHSPPASLRKILALREYDLLRSGLQVSRSPRSKPRLALGWRNLVNDDACGYSSISRGSTHSKQIFDALEIFGPVDLGENKTSRMYRPPGVSGSSEFKPWYKACAGNALSDNIPIATGAIRGLLVSDLDGARALVKLYGKRVIQESDSPTNPSLARDLILLHPCIDLLDDDELDTRLRNLWHKRSTELSLVSGGGERPKLDDFPYDMPIALWGFFMQNDCSYMNPAGQYLARHLSMEHLPLLMAFLEYNSRSTIFLAELDAQESVPAITREVLSRRKKYYRSYDHDLFHGVAHFGIQEAAPVLETYTKQNENWPGKGVITLAGFEESRYCWTEETEAAAPNPLDAGILREIAQNLQTGRDDHQSSDYRIGEFCGKGLNRMDIPMIPVPDQYLESER